MDLFLAPSSRLSPAPPPPPRAADAEDEVIEVRGDHSFSGTSRWEAMTKVDSLLVYRQLRRRGDERAGHLRYTSDALGEDVEVTGNPVLTICCGSSIGCFDVFCYLLEVSASGHAEYLTEGCFRSTHRSAAPDPDASPVLRSCVPIERRDCAHAFTRGAQSPDVAPSDRVVLKFHLRSMSHCFSRGSRVQILIAGADSKHFHTPPRAESRGESWELVVRPGRSMVTLPVVLAEGGSGTAAGLFRG